MSSFKFDLFSENLGTVTIVTEDNLVFQGIVRRHLDDSRKANNIVVVEPDEFVLLELKCEPATIDDGQVVTIYPPLFSEDDIVKINVRKIVAVGPSNGCFDGTGGTGANTGNTKNSNSKNSKG